MGATSFVAFSLMEPEFPEFPVPEAAGGGGLSDKTGSLVERQPDKTVPANTAAHDNRVNFDTKFMNTYPCEITALAQSILLLNSNAIRTAR
jgi:hypothetical protein